MKRKWLILAACMALPLLVGWFSSFLTQGESSGPWYEQLQKPWFQPPSWVFGPVWTTLYLLMGASLFLVYNSPVSHRRRWALIAFFVQLVLNFFWSLIFFRWHQLGLATLEIFMLLAAIIWMIVTFYMVRPVAAYLQIPYLAWTSYATVLTTTIYWLNR